MLFLQNPSHFRPPYGTRSLQAYRMPLLVYHIQKRKVFFDYFLSTFFIIYDVFDTTISSCIHSFEMYFSSFIFQHKKKELGTGASRCYDLISPAASQGPWWCQCWQTLSLVFRVLPIFLLLLIVASFSFLFFSNIFFYSQRAKGYNHNMSPPTTTTTTAITTTMWPQWGTGGLHQTCLEPGFFFFF